MGVDELEIFKTNYEASVDAKYREQWSILTVNFEQAIMERDTKIVGIAHRNLLVEQFAMNHKLEQCTSTINLHLKQDKLDAELAFQKATNNLSSEHVPDLKRVVQTQR